MFEKLEQIEEKFERLAKAMSDPEVVADKIKYREHARLYSELEDVVSKYREYRKVKEELDQAREMIRASEDEELRKLATEESDQLTGKLATLEEEIKLLLLPKDPNDEKNVILEVRAGTGGDEATLFAQEIFRMYQRYAESKGWKIDLMSAHETGVGGIKEAIANIEGDKVYSRLKYESGVHRVQRVPETEASGRIHTSAVTVAILPEADEVEVVIDEKDLRVDTFCSSGPGGQSVNTTYSAVRITHLPTNLVVQCQDEKSWHKNKARALKVLRSRLFDLKLKEQQDAIARDRRNQVKSGDRSEKIRTYNFPQNRVTDHRINLTIHRLTEILDGNLDEVIDALITHYQAEKLKEEVKV
ncbi:MAG: peptide chain release factor 1 [Acidobacteriota bacterium]